MISLKTTRTMMSMCHWTGWGRFILMTENWSYLLCIYLHHIFNTDNKLIITFVFWRCLILSAWNCLLFCIVRILGNTWGPRVLSCNEQDRIIHTESRCTWLRWEQLRSISSPGQSITNICYLLSQTRAKCYVCLFVVISVDCVCISAQASV